VNDSLVITPQSLAYFIFLIIFYAFPYRPIMEEIWRRCACAARDDLFLILRCAISSIAAILNVKKHARELGRRRSWQATVTTERTRQRLRGSGGAGIGITGGGTAGGIQPIPRGIV
jgi:hypothetical protein